MKLLSVVFILSFIFFGCQPKKKSIVSEQKKSQDLNIKTITPVAKSIDTNEAPYVIDTGKQKFKVGQIKYKKIEYTYDKKKNSLQLKGQIEIYDQSLVSVIRKFDMNLKGTANFAGFAELVDKENKRIFAKITCLRLNQDNSYTCEDILIDLFLRYKKDLYSEQIKFVDKESKPLEALNPKHLPEEPEVESPVELNPQDKDTDTISSPKIVSLGLSEDIDVSPNLAEGEWSIEVDDSNPNANGRMVGRIFENHDELIKRASEVDSEDLKSSDTTDSKRVDKTPEIAPDKPDKTDKTKETPPATTSDELPPVLPQVEIEKDQVSDSADSMVDLGVEIKKKVAEGIQSIIDIYRDYDGKSDFKLLGANSVMTDEGFVRPYAQVHGAINGGKLIASSNLLEKQSTLKDKAYFKLSAKERKRYYGSYELVEFVPFIGQFAREISPNYILRISDLSQKGGGKLQNSNHKSHQNGLDVDIALILKTPEKGFVDVVDEASGKLADQFLIKENFEFLMRVTNNQKTRVSWIFTDQKIKNSMCSYAKKNNLLKSKSRDQVIYMLSRLRHEPNHDDHYHIRIACTKYHPRCDRSRAAAPVVDDCS